jgi:hypothetical protein
MIAIVAAIVGVVVLGTLACTALVNYAVEDGAGDPPVRPTPSTEIPTAATGLNRTVRDGRLAFAVTAVECGIDRVGDDVLNEQAEGQFCQVSLTVTNHGDEARTFFGTTQYAYDAAGQKHEIDSAGMIYLDEEISLAREDIEPGGSVDGVVLFDIPNDASIVKLELHDSLFSTGATVTL